MPCKSQNAANIYSLPGSDDVADCKEFSTANEGLSNSDQCAICPAGYYFEKASGSGCVKCKPGTYRDAAAVTAAADSKCTPCAYGKISKAGATASSDCSDPCTTAGHGYQGQGSITK